MSARSARATAAALGALVASVLVVGLLLATDQSVVRSPDRSAQVSFGRPLPWVTQDLSALQPPALEDVALVGTAIAAVVMVLRPGRLSRL